MKKTTKASVRTYHVSRFLFNPFAETWELDYEFDEEYVHMFDEPEYEDSEYSRYSNQRLRRSELSRDGS